MNGKTEAVDINRVPAPMSNTV